MGLDGRGREDRVVDGGCGVVGDPVRGEIPIRGRRRVASSVGGDAGVVRAPREVNGGGRARGGRFGRSRRGELGEGSLEDGLGPLVVGRAVTSGSTEGVGGMRTRVEDGRLGLGFPLLGVENGESPIVRDVPPEGVEGVDEDGEEPADNKSRESVTGSQVFDASLYAAQASRKRRGLTRAGREGALRTRYPRRDP